MANSDQKNRWELLGVIPEDAKKSARKNSPNVDKKLIQAGAFIDTGQFSDAIEPLKQYIKLNPDDARAHSLLGIAYLKLDQYTKAIEPLQQAISMNTRTYEDLMTLLDEVRRSIPDDRLIWCVPSLGFETTVACRRGLITGGALSPWFLQKNTIPSDDAHYTIKLRSPHILVIEKAISPPSDWIPLFEDIAKTKNSLLIITHEMSDELLRMIFVNQIRKIITCSVVGFGDGGLTKLPGIDALAKLVKAPPQEASGLPRPGDVWIRRTASVLFPDSEKKWKDSLSDIAVISVGGDDCDELEDRLRFLMKAIQAPGTPFS